MSTEPETKKEEEKPQEVQEEPVLKTRPEILMAMLQYETEDIENLEQFYTVVCVPILQHLNAHAEYHDTKPEIWLILSFVKKIIDERKEFVTGENSLSSNCETPNDLQGPIGKWPDLIPNLLHYFLLYIHHYYLYRETFLHVCEKFPTLANFIESREKEFGNSILKQMQSIIQYPHIILNWINLLLEKTEKKKDKPSPDEKKLTATIEILKATIQRYQAATTDGIPDEVESQGIPYKLSVANRISTYGRIINVDYDENAGKTGAPPPPPAAGAPPPPPPPMKRLKGKIISKISPHSQECFKQISNEIEANKRLHHMNVLKMEKYIEDELFHYLMFPDTENWELSDVLRKNVVLSEEAARPIFRELIHGVQHMHSNGVIHGQITPNAIVFYKNHVRISDFSLCHLAMPGESKAYNRGPLIYMAPETYKVPFDGAANDIWSCGIILYEMLAGANPFRKDGDSHTQTNYQHTPKLSKFGVNASPAIKKPKLTQSAQIRAQLTKSALAKDTKPKKKVTSNSPQKTGRFTTISELIPEMTPESNKTSSRKPSSRIQAQTSVNDPNGYVLPSQRVQPLSEEELQYGEEPPKKKASKMSTAERVKRGDIIYPNSFSSTVIFLLKGILNKVPHERFTVQQILSHPWMLKTNEIPIKYTLTPQILQTQKKKKKGTETP